MRPGRENFACSCQRVPYAAPKDEQDVLPDHVKVADNVCSQDRRQFALLTSQSATWIVEGSGLLATL